MTPLHIVIIRFYVIIVCQACTILYLFIFVLNPFKHKPETIIQSCDTCQQTKLPGAVYGNLPHTMHKYHHSLK